MKKVTIITSLYRGAKHLRRFLHNITAQTIFSDCELYILNANSPESTVEENILSDFSSYKNIRYEKLKKDPGVYACWNLMIKNSESKYITNANVDDKIMIDCIEKHVDLLDNSEDIDVAYCVNVYTHNPSLEPWMVTGNEDVFPTAEFSKDMMCNSNLPHNHPVWRRSLHDRFGMFEEEKYVSGSDWDFWLRCTFNDVKMKLINERLGIYYRNPEGVSSKQENMDRNLKEVRDIREKYTNQV